MLKGLRVLVTGDGDARGHERLAPLRTPGESVPLAALTPGHPAVMFFTSGSTGTPKGVVHSHASALAMLTSTSEALGAVGPDDVVQVAEPPTVEREPRPERDGCIGTPVGGAQLRTDPRTGEVEVRGPMTMLGYWDDEQLTGETVRDGWLRTGDLATRDADGVWWFTGRIKDLIVRCTSKITPGEVESALEEHRAVAAAAVVAAADPEEGQVPVAFVVLRRGAAVSAAELVAFLGERIARYKLPVRVHFLDALPLTPSGKIAHRELREPGTGSR